MLIFLSIHISFYDFNFASCRSLLIPFSLAGQGMKKTLSKGKDLVIKGSTEKTPLLAARDSNPPGDNVLLHLGVLKAQAQEPPTPAVIVYDQASSSNDQLVVSPEFNIPFKKPTTASMLNFVDFSSDAASQNGSLQSKSSAAIFTGYDIIGGDIDEQKSLLMQNNVKQSQVVVIAEINTDSRNVLHNPDLADEHIESKHVLENVNYTDEVFPANNLNIDSASSHLNNVGLGKDAHAPSYNSDQSDNSNLENRAHKESTSDDHSSSKISSGDATFVTEHVSFVEASEEGVMEASGHSSEHNFPVV